MVSFFDLYSDDPSLILAANNAIKKRPGMLRFLNKISLFKQHII